MIKNPALDIKIDCSVEIITIHLDDDVVHIPNVAIINKMTDQIVTFGVGLNEFRHNPELKQVSGEEFECEAVPLLALDRLIPEQSANIILRLITSFCKQNIFLTKHASNVAVSIPNYENFDQSSRDEFEFILAKYLRAKSLMINNDKKLMSYKKAIFIQLTYIGSISLFTIVFIQLGGFVAMKLIEYFSLEKTSTVYGLFSCAGVIFIPLFLSIGFGAFLGELLWILVMRLIYSKQLLIIAVLYFWGSVKHDRLNPLSLTLQKLLLSDKHNP